jgi:uncharacterized phage-associated protein
MASTLTMLPSGAFGFPKPKMSDEDPDGAKQSRELIKAVYDNYRKYSAIQLSNATHRKNTPWYEVYEEESKGSPPQGTDIPTDKIKAHYQKLANERG